METGRNREYVVDATIGRVHLLVRVHASRSGLRGFAQGARATNQPEALVVDNITGHRLGAPGRHHETYCHTEGREGFR